MCFLGFPFNIKYKEGNTWKSKIIAQLIIGYRGYIPKLEEAGYTVEAEIVTKEEVEKGLFKELRGSETKIMHSPIRTGIRTRENIALAYCIIKHKENPPVISVLSKEEMEEMAKKEQYIDEKKVKALGNVWQSKERSTDYGQMCIKTVIRNAVKKVNLQIANEMSNYEGKRDSEVVVEKQELKIINDLPKVDFEAEGEVAEKQETALTQEEIDAIKAEEFRVAKEGE